MLNPFLAGFKLEYPIFTTAIVVPGNERVKGSHWGIVDDDVFITVIARIYDPASYI